MQIYRTTENSGISTITMEDNPMINRHRKLKLNIKGRNKKLWGPPLFKAKAGSIGVDVHDLNHKSSGHIEVLVAGEMGNLWQVINWAKRSKLFFQMNEILVEFIG